MERIIWAVAFALFLTQYIWQEVSCSSINCIRLTCKEAGNLMCNQSLILISDVTNRQRERDSVAFENMKRACMGKTSCNTSRVCNQNNKQDLVVYYFCVDAGHIRSKTCGPPIEKLTWDRGYIQSPGYPGATSYQPCRWRIEPPNGSFVVLSLYDILISSNKEDCDGGLTVSGSACDGEGHEYAPRLLCGGDSVNSLVRCGIVDIKLSQSKRRVYPLRFWLSFIVHSRDHSGEPSKFQASLLPCSDWIYSMDTSQADYSIGSVAETTPAGVASNVQTNNEVLIIMLSVISGICAILIIVLIVICIRCRLLQICQEGDHLYTDRSPGMQAHFEYISSLEASEKPRPHLADGYFEVADALPVTQRGETPTSPAYAEVEQFPQFRKGPWSSVCDESPKALRPPVGEARSSNHENKSTGEKQKGSGSDTTKPKRGVLLRLKYERNKQGEKDKKYEERQSNGPKVIVATVKKETSSSAAISGTLSRSNTDDEGFATYEQIEEYAPVKSFPKLPDKTPPVPSNHPSSRKTGKGFPLQRSSSAEHIFTVSSVKDFPKASSDKSNKSQLTSDVTEKVTNRSMSYCPSLNMADMSKTLPHKHSKGYFQTTGMKNNNYKRMAYKDVPRTSGIVKNGIQKFEQNGSISVDQQ